MSVNLSIKSVPDEWAERLRQRAERNHRSLQGELMALVERAVQEAPAEPAGEQRGTLSIGETGRRAAARFAALPPMPEDRPRSVDIIRDLRDTRHGG